MIKIYVQNTHSKIYYNEATNEEKNKVLEIMKLKLSAVDESMKHNPLVKKGFISAVKYFYNEEYDLFPTGFLPFVEIYLNKAKIEYEIIDKRSYPTIDKELLKKIIKNEITFGQKNITPYDYQVNALVTAIKEHTGLIELPTGMGKSFLAFLLTQVYKKSKVILLLPTIDLTQQTYLEFKNVYGEENVGIIQGSNVIDDKRITMVCVFSYEKAIHLFPDTKVVIVDECHLLGSGKGDGDLFSRVLYSLQNASIRIGLSATCEDLDNSVKQMALYGNLGPVIYREELDENMGEDSDKTLSDVEVQIYKAPKNEIPITGSYQDVYEKVKICERKNEKNYKDKIEELKKDGYEIITEKDTKGKYILKGRKFVRHGDAWNLFVNNKSRNELIANIAKKHKRVLILFSLIEHGEKLKELLPNAILIHGEHDAEEKRDAIKKLLDNEDAIVIASDVFRTGVNIKWLQTGINASGGKSTIKVIQGLGRTTRKHGETNKNKAVWIDIDDTNLNKIGENQTKKRINIYKNRLKLKVTYKELNDD